MTLAITLAIVLWLGSMGLPGSRAVRAQTAVEPALGSFEVRDGGIDTMLAAGGGDPGRGRQVVVDAQRGNCLICHKITDVNEHRFQGDIGPSLDAVGERMSAAQLRLRIVDSTRINADSVMPAYHRTAGLKRVAARWRNKPVLSAGEVEDVVAYLRTLRGAKQ